MCAGRKPDEQAKHSMQDRYGPVEPPRCYSNTKAREWPSILQSASPKPTSIVLQAITRSMLLNTSPHVVRGIAFSIYSKAAGSQLSGRTAAVTEAQDAPEDARHTEITTESATGDAGHCQSGGLLQQTNGNSVKSAVVEQPCQARPKNSDTPVTENCQQSQKLPAPFSWAGCCAGAQAFRVAENQQSCTLASAAAEPAADSDQGKVFRETGRSRTGSKPGLVSDNQHAPSRCDALFVLHSPCLTTSVLARNFCKPQCVLHCEWLSPTCCTVPIVG